jgi:hypothetical protein
MPGVNRVSVWRLGLLPDFDDPAGQELYFDLWDALLSRKAPEISLNLHKKAPRVFAALLNLLYKNKRVRRN